MEVCCDLEVDVNGEETFFLKKNIISVYSRKFTKLFGKSVCPKTNLKVIFNDFPGGAEGFELIASFCYNNGKTTVTSSNIILLHSAAKFMEMNNDVPDVANLLELTEKCMEEIRFWTWSELLNALKQCQDVDTLSLGNSWIEKFLDFLVEKLSIAVEASPCASTCSSDSIGVRFSCDSKSTESLKTRTTWWFEELLALSPNLLELLVNSMVTRKFDHVVIFRFLLYYQKSKFYVATSDEKRKILEAMLNCLYVLDISCISCKSLFGVLGAANSLNISKSSRDKLECMIGYQLDQAMLDNLLVPAPFGSNYLYDVNLVLRITKAFLRRTRIGVNETSLKKVASLIDLYIAEVAPDPCLKPSRFLGLVKIMPDSARDCYDDVYRVIDMYLEVHTELSEEEKCKISLAIDHEKLSADTRRHLRCNTRFPIQVSRSQPLKLKDLIQSSKSPTQHSEDEQVHLPLENMEVSGNGEKLKEHLEGIQWRVMELEKACQKMQTQMVKIMKTKTSSHSNSRSLPKLCS